MSTTTSISIAYGQRWKNIEPKICHSSLLCPKISAIVCSGDDIKVFVEGTTVIGRVIDICHDRSPPQFLMKVWLPETEIPPDLTLQPLNPATESKIIGMCGVIHTNWL